jgi:hypothetical protein
MTQQFGVFPACLSLRPPRRSVVEKQQLAGPIFTGRKEPVALDYALPLQ